VATARDIMTPSRECVSEDDSVRQASLRMVELRVPAIPVVGKGGMFRGMLTNRDVVELVARGQDPGTTSAGEVGHGDAPVGIDESLEDVVGALRDHRGGRVAVTDGDGVLVGVIGQRDAEAFVRVGEELGPNAAHLVTQISPRDEFSSANRGAHLLAALSALECIREGMSAAGKQGAGSILDFPCGYGRVLRVLKAAFPDARLAAGDIERDCADFCRDFLGAAPIYSDEDPAKVEIEDSFDLIWCGSLLTHLDADRWPGFLALLRDALEPTGVLVFTTHGPRDERTLLRFGLLEPQIKSVLEHYERSGFGYSDYHDYDRWGIAIASPQWVEQQLERLDGLRLVRGIPRGWDAPAPRQDVFACVRA
jgi:CBS domain-containing protein/SAM-dependent methyltransferase